MPFADFMFFWVKAVRNRVQENTIGSYYMTIEPRIAPYFRERDVRLNELTTIDLQEYYTYAQEVKNIDFNNHTIAIRSVMVSSNLLGKN